MNLNEGQLKEVEEMGGLFFSPDEIAINLELTEDNYEYLKAVLEIKNMKNPIVRAYMKGWLTTEIQLRKAIKQSAMNGSSPSQQMMMDYQREGRL